MSDTKKINALGYVVAQVRTLEVTGYLRLADEGEAFCNWAMQSTKDIRCAFVFKTRELAATVARSWAERDAAGWRVCVLAK